MLINVDAQQKIPIGASIYNSKNNIVGMLG